MHNIQEMSLHDYPSQEIYPRNIQLNVFSG